MKTILEHLETLPEPYRSQAIENCLQTLSNHSNNSADNLASAIVLAFEWVETPQGYWYWQRLWYSYTL